MNRSGVITLLILTSLIVLVFLFYWQVEKKNERETLETSPAAKSLVSNPNYLDIEGNPIFLDDYLGQTVIAFAWASWCPSCIDQFSVFEEVSAKYDSVAVLAFNRGEPVDTVKDFLAFYGLDNNFQLILDPTDHFFTSIDGYSMPETVIFSPNGDIFHHQRNAITKNELEFFLNEVERKFSTE